MTQVIKLMNSIPSLVTCGFSFLGFLVPDLDLDLAARDELVHLRHLGFVLVICLTVFLDPYRSGAIIFMNDCLTHANLVSSS